MRRAEKSILITSFVLAAILASGGAQADTWEMWRSLGPALHDQANLDVGSPDCMDMAMDPNTGYIYLAYFHQYGTSLNLTRELVYTWFDGDQWSPLDTVESFSNWYSPTSDDKIEYSPCSVSIAMCPASGAPIGGVLWSYDRDEWAGGVHESNVYLKYSEIETDGDLGDIENVFCPSLGLGSISYAQGTWPSIVGSLAFGPYSEPSVVFALNTKRLESPDPLNQTELGYSYRVGPADWEGSGWDGSEFELTYPVDAGFTSSVWSVLRGFTHVSLDLDSTGTWRMAYSRNDAFDEHHVQYTEGDPVSGWSTQQIATDIGHDDTWQSLVSLALDDLDRAHVAFEGDAIYYVEELAGSSWASPTAIPVTAVPEEGHLGTLGNLRNGPCGILLSFVTYYGSPDEQLRILAKGASGWDLKTEITRLITSFDEEWRPIVDMHPDYEVPYIAMTGLPLHPVSGGQVIQAANIDVLLIDDDTGDPIDNNSGVCLYPNPPWHCNDVRSSGHHILFDLEPGDYWLEADAEGYLDEIFEVSAVCETAEVTVRMEPEKTGCGASPVGREGAGAFAAWKALLPLGPALLLVGVWFMRRKMKRLAV